MNIKQKFIELTGLGIGNFSFPISLNIDLIISYNSDFVLDETGLNFKECDLTNHPTCIHYINGKYVVKESYKQVKKLIQQALEK